MQNWLHTDIKTLCVITFQTREVYSEKNRCRVYLHIPHDDILESVFNLWMFSQIAIIISGWIPQTLWFWRGRILSARPVCGIWDLRRVPGSSWGWSGSWPSVGTDWSSTTRSRRQTRTSSPREGNLSLFTHHTDGFISEVCVSVYQSVRLQQVRADASGAVVWWVDDCSVETGPVSL